MSWQTGIESGAFLFVVECTTDDPKREKNLMSIGNFFLHYKQTLISKTKTEKKFFVSSASFVEKKIICCVIRYFITLLKKANK